MKLLLLQYHKTEMNYKVNSFEYNQRLILKSTRKKNWIPISSSNQVTFQFKIPKIIDKKQLVVIQKDKSTMGKSKDQLRFLPSNKRSGMSSFIYAPEEFPEDASTICTYLSTMTWMFLFYECVG